MRWRFLAVPVVLLAPVALAAQSSPSMPVASAADVMRVVNAVFEGMRRVDSAMVRPLFHP